MFKDGDIVVYIGEHPDYENEYGPCVFKANTICRVNILESLPPKGYIEIKALDGDFKGHSQTATIASLTPATELNKLLYT